MQKAVRISFIVGNVFVLNHLLSYDIAVIQWITSCHKKFYDHTCNNTLAGTRNVTDNVRVNNAFSS